MNPLILILINIATLYLAFRLYQKSILIEKEKNNND